MHDLAYILEQELDANGISAVVTRLDDGGCLVEVIDYPWLVHINIAMEETVMDSNTVYSLDELVQWINEHPEWGC